jgi:galactokinase
MSVSVLGAAGMRAREAAAKAERFACVERRLRALPGAGAERVVSWFVPGRLEVLGKHTDYAGGRSLICAIERGHCIAAAARDDSAVRIVDTADGSVVAFALDPHLQSPQAGWANYPATVARRFARNFPGAHRGADMAFSSDLPIAAGMSSSSALMIAVFLVLADLNRLESHDRYRENIRTREDLAGYLATIENGQDFKSLAGDAGVGTFGGSEDHTAILCAEPGRLTQYAFCPARLERTVELPGGCVFAVASSGVAAQKTGSVRAAYNRAALGAQRILELWRDATGRTDGSLAAATASDAAAPDRIRDIVSRSHDGEWPPERLLARFDQFFEESERIIPDVTERLSAGDLNGIGPLVDRSQDLAERLLGNQIPETIALTRAARDLGAVAASSFGAGFGGSVWALVSSRDADGFIQGWAATYRERFPAAAARAQFFTTRPGPAALRL